MAIGTLSTFNVTGLAILDSTTVSQSIDLNPFGIWGRITDLRVFIHGVTHTFPDDLDFLLLGPGGANLEFWSDAGGATDITNFNFGFADSFGLLLPDQAAIAPSTMLYAPTDYGLPAEDGSNWGLSPSIIINNPAPTGTATFASAFGGLVTAGNWSLFVRDDVGGDVGSLMDWGMAITYNVIVKPEDFSGPIGANNNFYTSDILWQNDNGQAAIWLMVGTSLTSGGAVGPNPGPSWHVIDSGDFDSDGRSDILWQDNSGQAAVWLMNGTSLTSGGPVGPNPGPSWHVKASGDFNFDTKADILWQNDNGQAAIWLMDGTNLISGGVAGSFNPGPSWQIKGAGDYNGDGRSDILWQDNSGQAAIWLMNGTNLIGGGPVGTNPGPSWHAIDSGDFNNDGRSDILWQDDNGQAAIWLMNGTNLIGGGPVGTNPGASWHVEGSGDYNGDGKSDILWQNTDGTPAIWFMNGTNVISGGVVGAGNPGAEWDVIA